MAPDAYSSVCCVILEQLDRISPTPFTVIIKKNINDKTKFKPRVLAEYYWVHFQRLRGLFLLSLFPSNPIAPSNYNNNSNILFYLNININITTFVVYLSIWSMFEMIKSVLYNYFSRAFQGIYCLFWCSSCTGSSPEPML